MRIAPLIAFIAMGMTFAVAALVQNIHESARYHSAGLNPVGHSISVPGRGY